MVKCDGCYVRVQNGMLPACVKACAFGALRCLNEKEFQELERKNAIASLLKAVNNL